MNQQSIPLLSPAIGTRRELTVFRFGPAHSDEKIFIQASLHADEIPAMLTAVLLKRRLLDLEAQGALAAQIVLVPVANPIGLAQNVLGQFVGRFELGSGKNFNRHFLLFNAVIDRAKDVLGTDPLDNRRIVRQLMHDELERHTPLNEFEALQHELLKLSYDADLVIDLHCSQEAAMHLYTNETGWPEFEPLARYLGSQASMLANDSGGQSFDEAHSLFWWQLQQALPASKPVRNGTFAVTIECRGQRDVSYEIAQQDADALIDYLTWRGALRGDPKPLPDLPMPATPLAGSEQLYAPVSGILVHRVEVGASVRAGQALFDIVDPLTDATTTIASPNDGVLYMRRAIRFVTAGAPLGRVTGTQPTRTGMLLSA
jgi:predicted deacylase